MDSLNCRLGLLVFIGLCLGAVSWAEETAPRKIVSTVKVYSWNSTKGVWYVGQAIKTVTEFFGADGRLVSEELADGARVLLEKAVCVYGPKGLTKSYYGPDQALRRTVTIERSNSVETETAVSPDGAVLSFLQKKYDENGRLKESRPSGADGQPVFIKTYFYDKKENLLAIAFCNPDGKEAVRIDYEYGGFDERGDWTERSEYYTYADVHRRPHEIVYRRTERSNGKK